MIALMQHAEEPSEETFLHHQPLDSRPMVVRPRLSRGWDDDFYPDRIAKESEPATVVLWGGFGICRISGSPVAERLNPRSFDLPAAPD